MTGVYGIVVLLVYVRSCHFGCSDQRLTPSYYSADNQILKGHVFQWKNVFSPVLCGRDCSLSPQCQSFNYHPDKHLCELNNATRANNPDDLVDLQGSDYYDDKVNTPMPPNDTQAPTKAKSPDTSAEITTQIEPLVTNKSCKGLLLSGEHDNGTYTIFPDGQPGGVQVYCDMETDGGGWIVFQRRQDGSVDFYRNWTDYQAGFGDLNGEFWLGNDILRTLTATGQWHLRVEMTDWDGNSYWALYKIFAISDDEYRITVAWFDSRSTVGDSMAYHNGSSFTTRDRDNDESGQRNCARQCQGAWWFKECFRAHLNGQYSLSANVENSFGINWADNFWFEYSLKKCCMKIREA